MKLSYKAITKDGKAVKGEVEAKDVKEAATFLRTKGLLPTAIAPRLESQIMAHVPFVNAISLSDLVFFTRELSSMFTSGITLVQALRILKEQTENKAMADVIAGVVVDIEDGKPLSVAIAKYPKVFPVLYVSLIKSAEEGGLLDKILARLADNLDKEQKLRDEVRAALMYPLFVVITMVVVVIIMMVTAVPALSTLYSGFDVELPLPTLIVIGMSNFFVSFWPIIVIAVVCFIVFYRAWSKTAGGRLIVDDVSLKIPVIGKLLKQKTLAEFTRTLGLLIGSGALVVQALRGAAGSADNELYSNAIMDIANKVEKGVTIADGMAVYPLFPPILVQMVRIGEQTGKLDESLLKVADYFEREVDDTIKTLSTALQPFIIVVLGGGVIFLLLAIFLPIFNLVSVIK